MGKRELFTLLTAVGLGAIVGASRYWDDIHQMAFPPLEAVVWSNTDIVDEKVLSNSANLDQIMALNVPVPGSDAAYWDAFWLSITGVDAGPRGGGSQLSPLLPLYAYVAKHSPTTIYAKLDSSKLNVSLFNHFLQMGLLPDWYDHVQTVDSLLLTSSQAVLSFAVAKDEKTARRAVSDAFFAQAQGDGKAVRLNLENLRFAMTSMSVQERSAALTALKSSRFEYDPRGVQRLTLVAGLNHETLIDLIHLKAYSQKSMSSYMTTATMLGDSQYFDTLLADARDNAEQPTNFYCAACTLALTVDGLIGEPLYNAVKNQTVHALRYDSGFVVNDFGVSQ